jgi:hypothetical protein
MAKRRLKVHFRIPPYSYPRNAWRRQIYDAASSAMNAGRVSYRNDDALAMEIVLYFDQRSFGFHDVDNRLKDILDALQGRMGGPKSIRSHDPLIPNDRQICRVLVTKMLPLQQSHGAGSVTITKHRVG